MAWYLLNISASRMKFKNRLEDPKSINQRGFNQKSQFALAVWAVEGGVIDLGRSSSCNSGTSGIWIKTELGMSRDNAFVTG